MDAPRIVLLIFLLLFLFASPDNQRPSISQQRELEYLLADEQQALDLLNSTQYGDFDATEGRWINVTGLRQDDNYAWDLLPRIQERARNQQRDILAGSPSLHDDRSSILPLILSNGEQSVEDGNGTTDTKLLRGGFYENVTGVIRGHWVRSKVADDTTPPILNLTSLVPRITYSTQHYNRNITGRDGKLRIKLEEKGRNDLAHDAGLVRELRAEMIIKDETSSGDGWEMTLHGVHYPRQGGILLATTGQRFAGIFALPHFALTSNDFTLAQKLLNQTLHETIIKQENLLTGASLNPWSSSPNSPSESMYLAPHCEYVVYLQQDPVPITKAQLEGVEQELRFPTGAPLPTIPLIQMSALIFSPDCGFVLESRGPPDFAPQQGTHLVGQKLEAYVRQARRGILAFGSLICAEIFLLLRQMNESSTPSTRSRVSFYVIALMGLGDGFACVGLMLVSFFVDAAFLSLISTAFMAFLCVSFFGMKFLMDIWTVQAPERSERERRDAAANPTPTPASRLPSTPTVITAAGADTLPLPVTARRPADTGTIPIIISSDQDLGAEGNGTTPPATQTTMGSARREMGALYSRFYFLLLSIAFLSLHATSWPTKIRSAYTNILAFVYLSFWVPQIYRNVIRNCRKALGWEFVIGQSILRLAPFAYFYIVQDNILFVETDPNAALALMAWVWIQVWALVSQEILGPRFFIPNGWAPPAYDYHPVLREDDQEAGATMPIGFTQATTAQRSPDDPDSDANLHGKRTFDCAICMQNLEVPVVPVGGGGGGGGSGEGNSSSAPLSSSSSLGSTTIFSRRAYMVTPCRHIFHSPCLEGWMKYRLQCPICRDDLPPL